jgi:Na+/melibiose symporter-like transporter
MPSSVVSIVHRNRMSSKWQMASQCRFTEMLSLLMTMTCKNEITKDKNEMILFATSLRLKMVGCICVCVCVYMYKEEICLTNHSGLERQKKKKKKKIHFVKISQLISLTNGWSGQANNKEKGNKKKYRDCE